MMYHHSFLRRTVLGLTVLLAAASRGQELACELDPVVAVVDCTPPWMA